MGVLVGVGGLVLGVVLPVAPVFADQTVITWPAPQQPVTSSTALFVPYRPAELTAVVPCVVIRAATQRLSPVTVLATGPDGRGLVLRTGPAGTQLLLDHRAVSLDMGPDTGPDCQVTVTAGPHGTTVTAADGQRVDFPGDPVPEVFAFHTDLDPAKATGMTVRARTASPFATRPTGLKTVLLVGQVLAVVLAVGLLVAAGRRTRSPPPAEEKRLRGSVWPARCVDAVVIAVLGGWAVIGPLAVDDGWAATIARNVAATGSAGNYYRWWNASETPFALEQQLLAPLTEVSLAPLWLRLPSTLLAIAVWFVLSRGVLPAALPALAATTRIRLLAALFLLVAWLPFDLGARPESYVALGVTSVLALLWRARGPAALGGAALVAGLTLGISPTAVVLAAPILVFSPRIVAILRATARGRVELAGLVLLLCGVGSVGLSVVFADQSWDGLITATDWHTVFGPSLPWYREAQRYQYLLGGDQQGSAPKRVPVLLTAAMLPILAVVLFRRRDRDEVDRAAVRLGAVVVAVLALMALVPSKWSFHLGALAGVFAAFLVVAVVVLLSRARTTTTGDRKTAIVAVAGGALVAAATAWAFTGPNDWWMPTVYDVPWAPAPLRPLGLPLDFVSFWLAVLVVIVAAVTAVARPRTAGRDRRAQVRRAALAGPALLVLAVAGTTVVVLLVSFLAAPIRRPQGSLALANLHRITGGPVCGLADDIQVLPDGKVLEAADESGQLDGFTTWGGFYPGAPPPDPPGTATSAVLWGSWAGGSQNTATMTSPWFVLPTLGPNDGVAVSVSGRTDAGNTLQLQFGRTSAAGGVNTLGARSPIDRVAPDEDPAHPLWRTIGVDAAEIPVGADRVRIQATDARTDPWGWLAFTGPRLRSVIGLTAFLVGRGPVLVTWPQSFLFPCLRDTPRVEAGLAQTPRAVIESPRPRMAEDRDPTIGGTFAGLVPFGRLYEVPTRLIGHPEIDWGALLLSGDTDAPDTYQRATIRVRRWGHDAQSTLTAGDPRTGRTAGP